MNNKYKAHISLPNFGESAQEKIESSHVTIVGIGGLGCPAALSLVAAGIGKLTLIDGDVIRESNLSRQQLFNYQNIGQSKVKVALDELNRKFDKVNIEVINDFVTEENANRILASSDLVLDCTDNQLARYALDDYCAKSQTPLVFAGVHQYEGQLSVFHFQKDYSYSSIFPQNHHSQETSCSDTGVLNTLTSILGNMQATEAIKIISGIGEVISGRILVYNALIGSTQFFSYSPKEVVSIDSHKSNYESHSAEISLEDFISSREDYFLIDLSEEGLLASDLKIKADAECTLNDLKTLLNKLGSTQKLLFLCERGLKSASAQSYVLKHYEGMKAYRLRSVDLKKWQNQIKL